MNKFKEFIVDEILGNYKIQKAELDLLINSHLEKNRELTEILANEENLDKIKRTRVFKQFFKNLKKDVYYSLRTYQRNDEHVSTAERKEYLQEFFVQLDNYFLEATTILDVGGGMFPYFFPFDKYKNIGKYTWIDKDKISFEKLTDFKEKNNIEQLVLLLRNIGEIREAKADLVLMLKLIPVVARQEKELLNILSKVDAKYIVITGSKEAMVKKQNIQEREELVLRNFIALSGRKIINSIDIPNEFGYVIS